MIFILLATKGPMSAQFTQRARGFEVSQGVAAPHPEDAQHPRDAVAAPWAFHENHRNHTMGFGPMYFPSPTNRYQQGRPLTTLLRIRLRDFLMHLRQEAIPPTAPCNLDITPLRATKAGAIFIVNGLTLDHTAVEDYAAHLRISLNTLHVIALSYAAIIKPGGGVLNGAKAQEEDLCRQYLDLYVSLCKFYGDTIEFPNPENRHFPHFGYKQYRPYFQPTHSIVTTDIHDTIPGREALTVSVVSSALPNLSADHDSKASEFDSFGLADYNPEVLKALVDPHDPATPLYREAVYNTLRNVIIGAAHVARTTPDKHSVFNIGAFGSGVFANNPRYVAKLWRQLLIDEGMRHYFDTVTFGIPRGDNLDAYLEVFADILARPAADAE